MLCTCTDCYSERIFTIRFIMLQGIFYKQLEGERRDIHVFTLFLDVDFKVHPLSDTMFDQENIRVQN